MEIQSVDMLRDAAEGMVLGGLKAGDSVTEQIKLYRQQLDAMVSTIPICNEEGYIKPESIRSKQAHLWCLNVMALEKMNALSPDDANGTMVVTSHS